MQIGSQHLYVPEATSAAGGSRSGTRPSELVWLEDRGSHTLLLPGHSLCRATGTPSAGRPSAVSSMWVVMGDLRASLGAASVDTKHDLTARWHTLVQLIKPLCFMIIAALMPS